MLGMLKRCEEEFFVMKKECLVTKPATLRQASFKTVKTFGRPSKAPCRPSPQQYRYDRDLTPALPRERQSTDLKEIMKLYYSAGACSLAPHIVLEESGLAYEALSAPTKTHKLEDGTDYYTINPLGYVPYLTLDDGRTLTYHDPRRFGRWKLGRNAAELFHALGPEPLDDQLTPTDIQL